MKKRFNHEDEAAAYLTNRGFKIFGRLVTPPQNTIVGIKTWGVLDYLGCQLKRKVGFTLPEIMLVIILIGFLSSMFIPFFPKLKQ